MHAFSRLGLLILGNACLWVSQLLAGATLTPLLKKATGNDARPTTAKNRDMAMWLKSAAKAESASVRSVVTPQQAAVGTTNGVPILTWGAKLTKEQADRNGVGITFAKQDRKNAHNTFDRKCLI